jgi:predicted permease
LPALARLLTRLSPVPADARPGVEADLHELFLDRRHQHGLVHAHWRLYRDVASLWHTPGSSAPRQMNRQLSLDLLRDLGSDLRYAARLFARQPAILLLTIAGLSLGLGIATSAFSIMNAAVLRGEGLVDSHRTPGIIRTTDRSVSTSWKYSEFLQLREGSTRMQVEAVLTGDAQVRARSSEADPPSASIGFVSAGFFDATGGRMAAGRALGALDDQPVGPPPVVVSFGFWTSALNRDPNAIGRTLRIGRTDATIVGVAARGFTVPSNRRLWMPLTAYAAVYNTAPVSPTSAMEVQVFGRLRPDAPLAEAEAQLSTVAAALQPATPGGDSALRVRLDSSAGLGRQNASDTLAVTVFVFAVIGLVLVLACANVATVLVSAAITREREMGVRAALGASRRRIVRQLITESLALGSVAALVGLLVAYWTIPVIATMIEAPAGTDLAPDLTVFVFLGLVTIITGVGAGLAPARHGRGADLVSPLKGEARHHRVAPRRLRSLLVVTQAAVSVLLIVMAALFVRATYRAAAIDVGFEASGLYAISPGLDPFAADSAAITGFWPRAMAELQAVPGITAVALSEPTPFGALTKTWTLPDTGRVVNLYGTRAEYFDVLGVRTLAGRTFTSSEVSAKAPVAVVSQSFARAFWPDSSPVGQMLPREGSAQSPQPVVIGVVADAITTRLHERNTFAVYEPIDPANEKYGQLLVRIAPGAVGVIDQAAKRLRVMDPQADIRVTSVAALVQQEARQPRTLALLTGIVGAIAIVLCVIGLYGLTASVVGQRAREMAVRVAMGADPWNLLRLLMWDSLRPVLFGLAIGAGAALLVSRIVVAAMFFSVSPQDPLAFGAAIAILLAAAAAAVLVPTRRASRVDASLVLKRS